MPSGEKARQPEAKASGARPEERVQLPLLHAEQSLSLLRQVLLQQHHHALLRRRTLPSVLPLQSGRLPAQLKAKTQDR